jgi:phosphoserine phosphatase
MIVCDWNGTLFRDPLEERFFFGLCRRAFYKAVRSGSLRRISSLLWCAAMCFREYFSAKGRKMKTLSHIANIVKFLNPAVFSGMTRAELEEYAWKYAFDIQKLLDMRLISPIRRAARDHSIPVAVISSGCREGIVPALELQGLEIREIVANEFDIGEDGLTRGFDFRIAENKADLLRELLESSGVKSRDVMYIGDSLADTGCFEEVGFPVVSFYADQDRRERFVRRYGSFAPVDQEDFDEYLRSALE